MGENLTRLGAARRGEAGRGVARQGKARLITIQRKGLLKMEGYRLLKSGEVICEGDEFLSGLNGGWKKSTLIGWSVDNSDSDCNYRRKIDQSTEVQIKHLDGSSSVAPMFEQRANATIKRVTDTFGQRGTEYGDTMRDCQWLVMKAVARKLGVLIPDNFARVIAIAGMVDIKYQRYQGGYKDDNGVDLIAYQAFLTEEMNELLRECQNA